MELEILFYILGLVVVGILVTLYVDYQADVRAKVFAEHLDLMSVRVRVVEDKIEEMQRELSSQIEGIKDSLGSEDGEDDWIGK